ncbi:Protein of unknown function [Pyronema omphalodes CBS 100304]|uniref:Uncharacterized protein n=1 Tax=Pyronema omphalodes (strain CBS 100304) TaxID=1076935 RepID=U4LTH4_PYROM|nr:Protein of unknown function [Pyronema omphalodes CBS 100304]
MVVSHSFGSTKQAKSRTSARHKLPATPGTRTTTVVCPGEVSGDSTEEEHDEVEITPEEALLAPDIGHGLQVSHRRLKNSWEQIFEKYSRHYDDSEVDIIDWRTFEIIESRGHIARLPSMAEEEDHWTELAELEREIREGKNKKRRRTDDDNGQDEASASKTARKVVGSKALLPLGQCRPPFDMPTDSTKKKVLPSDPRAIPSSVLLPQDVLQGAEEYVPAGSGHLQVSGRTSDTHSLSDRSISKTSSKLPRPSQKPSSGFSSPMASSFTSTSSSKTEKATINSNFTPTKKLLRISSKPQPTALEIIETTESSDSEDELAASNTPAFLTPRRIFSPTIFSSPKPTPKLTGTRKPSPKVINTPKPKTTPFKASHLSQSTSTTDDLSEDELQSTTTSSPKTKPNPSAIPSKVPQPSRTAVLEPESEDELQFGSFNKENTLTTPLKGSEKQSSRPILPLDTPQQQNPDIWAPTPDDPFYDPTWHDQHPDGTPQHFPVPPPQPVFVTPTAPAKQTKTPKPKSTTKKILGSQTPSFDLILESPVVRTINKTSSKSIESPVIRALKRYEIGTPRRKEHSAPSKRPSEKKKTEKSVDRGMSFLDFLDRYEEDEEDELLHGRSIVKGAGTPKKKGTPKKVTPKVVKTPKRVVVVDNEVGIVDDEAEGSVAGSTAGLRKDLSSDVDDDEHLEPRKWKTQRTHRSLFEATVSEKPQPELKSVVSIEQAHQADQIPEPPETFPSPSKRLASRRLPHLSTPRESFRASPEEPQEPTTEAKSNTTTSSEPVHATVAIHTIATPPLPASSYRTSPELQLFSEMTQRKCGDWGYQCQEEDCTTCDVTRAGISRQDVSDTETGVLARSRREIAATPEPMEVPTPVLKQEGLAAVDVELEEEMVKEPKLEDLIDENVAEKMFTLPAPPKALPMDTFRIISETPEPFAEIEGGDGVAIFLSLGSVPARGVSPEL